MAVADRRERRVKARGALNEKVLQQRRRRHMALPR